MDYPARLKCKTCGREIIESVYLHTVWELNARTFASTPEGSGTIYHIDAGSFCSRKCMAAYLTKAG